MCFLLQSIIKKKKYIGIRDVSTLNFKVLIFYFNLYDFFWIKNRLTFHFKCFHALLHAITFIIKLNSRKSFISKITVLVLKTSVPFPSIT